MSGAIKTAPNNRTNCHCAAFGTLATNWESACRSSFGLEYDYAGDWEWADCPQPCFGDSALWTNRDKGVPKCKHARYADLTTDEKKECCLTGKTGAPEKSCDPKYLDKFAGECPSIVGTHCSSAANFITQQCQNFCTSRMNNGKAECDQGVKNYCRANPDNEKCKCLIFGESSKLEEVRRELGIKGDYTCWYELCGSAKHPFMTSSMKKVKDNCTMVNCVIKDVQIHGENIGKIDMSQDCEGGRGGGGGDDSDSDSDSDDEGEGFKTPEVVTESMIVYKKFASGDIKGALALEKNLLYIAGGIAFSVVVLICVIFLCCKRFLSPPQPQTLF